MIYHQRNCISAPLSSLFKSSMCSYLLLQEVREKYTHIALVKDVLFCASAAASNGSYACAVCINPKRPVVHIDGKPRLASRSSVSIVHDHPRLLAVILTVGRLRVALVSARAPYADGTAECLESVRLRWRCSPMYMRAVYENMTTCIMEWTSTSLFHTTLNHRT